MTSRERVTAAFNHAEPDRTPIFEYVIQSPVADAILARPYAADERCFRSMAGEHGWEAAVRQMAIDYVDLARILGHDMLYIVPNPLPDKTPENTASEQEKPRPDDPVEEMRLRVERAEASGVAPPDEQFLIYAMLREEMAAREMDLPMLAPAYVHGVWTDTALMQTMILAPELVRHHFAHATQRALDLIDGYLSLGIALIGVGGDFAGNRGPLISPDCYRKFIVPEVRKLSDRIHSAGGKAVNASDGNLWPVIDDFLTACNVDGYIEIDYRAGMDLGKLKDTFGNRTTFLGNLDCAWILSFGTPDDVRQHVTECLRQGRPTGHILCSCNAITSSVPVISWRLALHIGNASGCQADALGFEALRRCV